MVRISEVEQFSEFPETFLGNFGAIYPRFKVPELLVEWKAWKKEVLKACYLCTLIRSEKPAFLSRILVSKLLKVVTSYAVISSNTDVSA